MKNKYIKLFENYGNPYIIGNYYNIDVSEFNIDDNDILLSIFTLGQLESKKFKCIEVEIDELYNNIKESIAYIEDWQREIIDTYKNDENSLKNTVIITDDKTGLIDGHHRVVAMYELGIKKCKSLDISYEK